MTSTSLAFRFYWGADSDLGYRHVPEIDLWNDS